MTKCILNVLRITTLVDNVNVNVKVFFVFVHLVTVEYFIKTVMLLSDAGEGK